MESINSRIKILREHLNLSQEEFANQIGFKRNSVSLIENGNRNISEKGIKVILEKFPVYEEWLRNGNGEMLYDYTPEEKFTLLLADIKASNNSSLKQLIEKINYLDEEYLHVLEVMVDALINKKPPIN
jgi:transcriptional regulator with XRE-family HTH domain